MENLVPHSTPQTVRDLMESEVFTVSPDTNLPELQRRFTSSRVGALPVVDREKRIVGIVSRADIMRRFSLEQSLAELADSDFDQVMGVEDDDDSISQIGSAVGRRLSQMHAHDIMKTEVETIPPDAAPEEAARIMVERRIHRLPVVDGDQLIGIVSAFDFMRLFASSSD
jgi:CBS domain-containing protein